MHDKIIQRIIHLVNTHQGMKSTELSAKLMVDFIAASWDDIHNSIEQCVASGDIKEVEYTLHNSRTMSFYLPKETYIEFK